MFSIVSIHTSLLFAYSIAAFNPSQLTGWKLCEVGWMPWIT